MSAQLRVAHYPLVGDVLLARENELYVASRITHRLGGDIDIDGRAVFPATDGFISGESSFERFKKDLALFLDAIRRDDELVDRASYGFGAGVPEQNFRAIAPVQHRPVPARRDHRVGRFVEE